MADACARRYLVGLDYQGAELQQGPRSRKRVSAGQPSQLRLPQPLSSRKKLRMRIVKTLLSESHSFAFDRLFGLFMLWQKAIRCFLFAKTRATIHSNPLASLELLLLPRQTHVDDTTVESVRD